jgi:uncharacterized protein
MRKLRIIIVSGFLFLLGGCSAIQRKFLFHPTHHDRTNGLTPWQVGGKTIGFSRPVASPEKVWLVLHGNGGQAADRTYALACFSSRDAVFILEYPGYGKRSGRPSREAFDQAAEEAYRTLRTNFPNTPLGVVGESIGSGPASALAKQDRPPDKIVLIVPFDDLAKVADYHMPYMPVRQILGATWNNAQSLSKYQGPIEIFGATNDSVIPIAHAKNLARELPRAKFREIAGGHNDWSSSGAIAFRIP